VYDSEPDPGSVMNLPNWYHERIGDIMPGKAPERYIICLPPDDLFRWSCHPTSLQRCVLQHLLASSLSMLSVDVSSKLGHLPLTRYPQALHHSLS
jgi:hypothetical protein